LLNFTSHSQAPTIQALLERIKVLEDSQAVPSVGTLVSKITNYDFRRHEDFDKYEAQRLSEQLAVSARLSSHAKAPAYDAIASTLRQKLSTPVVQFQADNTIPAIQYNTIHLFVLKHYTITTHYTEIITIDEYRPPEITIGARRVR
jgi:hypothetical protein